MSYVDRHKNSENSGGSLDPVLMSLRWFCTIDPFRILLLFLILFLIITMLLDEELTGSYCLFVYLPKQYELDTIQLKFV